MLNALLLTEIYRSTALVQGLDHVQIVVQDLAAAAEQFKRLGFTIKPGRPHANGLQNNHIKFKDGTQIELMTVKNPKDALAKDYQAALDQGEGAVFFGLFAPYSNVARDAFNRNRIDHQGIGSLITFPDANRLFLGPRNFSPTDRTIHYEHSNQTQRLKAITLGRPLLPQEREILKALCLPLGAPDYNRIPLRSGALKIDSTLSTPWEDRPVTGLTLVTSNLEATKKQLHNQKVEFTESRNSITLNPSVTHGVWLEFQKED